MNPKARLAVAIDTLYRRLREVERQAFAKHKQQDITLGDFRVLRAVERVGVKGVSAVAEYLGTTQPAATVAVARLEGRGLIARSSDQKDARRKSLVLTVKGKQYEQAHSAADLEAAELLLASIPKAEQQEFVEQLIRWLDPAPNPAPQQPE